MNEMRVSNGFMNGVTSLFVPNLCLEDDNNVAVANGLTHKNPQVSMVYMKIFYRFTV